MIFKNRSVGYTIIISSIGSALEYYCFIIYIMLAQYLGQLFFSTQSKSIATLNTLVIFAIAYLVAPISAFSFSFIADRIGRKRVMLVSIMLMAIATFAIGILPTQSSIGILAPLLLIILRLLQGLAQGAELPGAITFINEHASNSHQARSSGFLFFAVGSGALLSALVNYIVTHVLNEQEMLAFGWRIPFLLAGLLGIIGYKIRAHTLETPHFLKQKRSQLVKAPIIMVIKEHFSKIIIGVGLVWAGAALVNFGLYLPSFLQLNFGYDPKHTYLAFALAFAFDFLLIIFGSIADKISLKRFYLIGLALNIIFLYPVMILFKLNNLFALYLANFLYHLLILLLATCYSAMLTRLFHTKVRYSGVATAYLGAYSIAGIVPLIVNRIYVYSTNLNLVISFLIFSCFLSLLAGIRYRDWYQL